ncbi:UbiD family decarboxylase [Thermodesulfobacteriota bacterium]
MTVFQDLRQWIDQAEKIGELAVVEGADTNCEIGTITQLNAKNKGPAVVYRKIKGYPPDFRVITNMQSNIRTNNITFGMPIDNSIGDTVRSVSQMMPQWHRETENFEPVTVETGPIMENVVEGDKIDLNIFPVPLWHEEDGGPYIGTAVAIITKDPDTGHVNVGTYRCQLLDNQHVGIFIAPGKGAFIHRAMNFERNQSCPMVMVFGIDPLLFALSCHEMPQSVCELSYHGAVLGKAMPVIMGKTTGLPIPANAEIAIEGFVDPSDTMLEGPFGEWTGYYAGGQTQQSFLKPNTLYYRNDPVLSGSPPAKTNYSDHNLMRAIWRSGLLYNELAENNVQDVKGVWYAPAGGTRYLQIISLKQRYAGHAAKAGHIASQGRSGAFHGRYTIIVDEDVDPYDLEDVMWAVGSRSNPAEIDIIQKGWTSHLDPILRKPTKDLTRPRGIIYAVKPFEWKDEFAAVNVASEKARKEAFSKWKGVFGDRWETI